MGPFALTFGGRQCRGEGWPAELEVGTNGQEERPTGGTIRQSGAHLGDQNFQNIQDIQDLSLIHI